MSDTIVVWPVDIVPAQWGQATIRAWQDGNRRVYDAATGEYLGTGSWIGPHGGNEVVEAQGGTQREVRVLAVSDKWVTRVEV